MSTPRLVCNTDCLRDVVLSTSVSNPGVGNIVSMLRMLFMNTTRRWAGSKRPISRPWLAADIQEWVSVKAVNNHREKRKITNFCPESCRVWVKQETKRNETEATPTNLQVICTSTSHILVLWITTSLSSVSEVRLMLFSVYFLLKQWLSCVVLAAHKVYADSLHQSVAGFQYNLGSCLPVYTLNS